MNEYERWQRNYRRRLKIEAAIAWIALVGASVIFMFGLFVIVSYLLITYG